MLKLFKLIGSTFIVFLFMYIASQNNAAKAVIGRSCVSEAGCSINENCVNGSCAADPCPPGDTSTRCVNERCQSLVSRGCNAPAAGCYQEWTSDCSGWNGGGGGSGGICPTGTTYICGTPAVIKCANSQADCPEPYKFTGWQTGDETPSCQQLYPNTGPGKQFCQTNCSCVAPTPLPTATSTRPPTPKPTPSLTPVPVTPSPTPVTTGQCVNTKVYTNGWVELTPEAFKGLTAGIQVYYCVNGVTNSNIFDAGRFTINGVLRPETTIVRPNSNDFCDLYTIPANTYTFKIQGELHHTILGWL